MTPRRRPGRAPTGPGPAAPTRPSPATNPVAPARRSPAGASGRRPRDRPSAQPRPKASRTRVRGSRHAPASRWSSVRVLQIGLHPRGLAVRAAARRHEFTPRATRGLRRRCFSRALSHVRTRSVRLEPTRPAASLPRPRRRPTRIKVLPKLHSIPMRIGLVSMVSGAVAHRESVFDLIGPAVEAVLLQTSERGVDGPNATYLRPPRRTDRQWKSPAIACLDHRRRAPAPTRGGRTAWTRPRYAS